MILVPLKSLKSEDDVTWSEIVPGPVQNFLETIEVEWYYERNLELKQSEKGIEK